MQFSRYVDESVLEGHRFVWRNVVILLSRTLQYPPPATNSIRTELPEFTSLTPLDKTGGYILQATVRLENGSSPNLRELGRQDLDSFRDRIKGVVEMKTADRLTLDTRVK
jgi:mediator of RNA polymerase II transcription subunit 18, fungi type